MKCLIIIIKLFLLLFFIASCSDKNSILSTKIEKDPGLLKVLNTSGFIGATVAGTSLDHVITIKSQGGLSIEDLSVTITTSDPIGFKGGSFPGSGGTCKTSLNSGSTCTIVLLYEPQDTNSHLATLNFSYKDAFSSSTLQHQVSADSNPILSFEYGTLYDFGNKFIGSSTDLKIKISNTGKVIAENITVNNLAAPFSFKGGAYPGIGGNCGIRVAPGEFCELVVNYSPLNNGEHIQDINLTYLNTGRTENNNLNLIAWGFTQAELSISDPTGHNFGTVASGHPHEKVFTITHSGGDVTATGLGVQNLSSPFGFKGGSYPGTGGTCTLVLSKDTASCTIVVVLQSLTSGTWSNSFTLSYFNGSSPITITRSLGGVTKLRPTLSISPTGTTDYGVVKLNTNTIKTLTVQYESGELAATLSGLNNNPLSTPFSYTGGTYPGTGGTCTTTLSAGSCTIKVSYAPTSRSSSTLNTYFSYHDQIETKTLPVISFQGKTEGEMTASGGAFGNVVNGQTKDVSLTINASQGSALSLISVNSISGPPFQFVGGSFPGTGSTCTTSLSAGASCFLKLRFSSTIDGLNSGSLTLNYFNGAETKALIIDLSGTITPAANLSMTDTSYGTISVNSTLEKTITITNSSTKEATGFSIFSMPIGFSFKNGNFPGTGGTCNTSFSSSCRIVIVFNPTSATDYSGTIKFKYDDGTGTTQYVFSTLTGTGENTSNLFLSRFDTVSFNSLTFYVGQTADLSFTLFHGGSATPATISSTILEPATDFTLLSNTCGSALSNGASCSMSVRFAPSSSGTKNSALKVFYNNGTERTVTRLLTGVASNPAILSFSPSSYDFGARSTDATYNQTFSVTNIGNINATIVTNILSGTGFTASGSTCSSTIAIGASCTITGKFTPVSATLYSGSIGLRYWNVFKYVDGYIPLNGSGTPTSILTFGSGTYDFGDIIQTQSSTRTITVTHSGPVPANNLSMSALSAPYSYKGGSYPGTGGTCTNSISSGSCTIVVDFSPTTTGVKNQALTLSYNNGTLDRNISTNLTGESLAQAIISISETNPFNMGTTNLNNTIYKSFTLTNGGGVPGTTLSGEYDPGVFSFKDNLFPGTGGSCTSSLNPGSSCTIVVGFRPTEAMVYNSNLKINYYDGLRSQTELKTLTGTGSNSLKTDFYLSSFSDEVKESRLTQSFPVGDLNGNQSIDKLHSRSTLISAVDEKLGKVIFQTTQHLLPDLIEGLSGYRLKRDINRDGFRDLILSIHKKEHDSLDLEGYVIRCARSGRILEFYLPTNNDL